MPRNGSTGLDAPGVVAPLDEVDLIAAARRDRRAFAPLYRRYADAVHRYCYRRLGNRGEAEDATSLVFTKALAGLDGYRAGSFRAWLFAIAANVVVDRLRARRPDRPLDDADPVADAAPNPEAAALAADDRRRLRAALAELPPEQRRVVELRLSGLSGGEIAAAVGKSRAAVDALQYRAVARLRSLLDPRSPLKDRRHGR